MNNQLLHTPEGVRDIFPEEYKKKRIMKEKLLELIRSHGFEDIETPTFEFFDVFSAGIGTTPSRELYKFFDKEGNTLVLRPDFTPSIARAFAKMYYDVTEPVKLCYSGSTFVNNSDLQGRLKESTQVGVEMYNDDSAKSDAHMIELMIECMLCAGFEEFTVSVGNVEFFRGLCEEFGIGREDEAALRENLSNKNLFTADAMLSKLDIDEDKKKLILQIPEVFGSKDVLHKFDSIIQNERSVNAINRLVTIYDILDKKDMSKYISFDLGMLSKYHYYTGVIFRAYTFGSGDALIKGGRYDNLLREFSKDAPATGFCISLDELLVALSRIKR